MICLLIGSVAVAALPFVGWLFGGPLFLVAFILAIVAMSKNNIGQGIVLLLATLTVPVVAQIFGFIAWAALGVATGSSTGGHIAERDAHRTPSSRYSQPQSSFTSEFGEASRAAAVQERINKEAKRLHGSENAALSDAELERLNKDISR
jgi:hypothetical protein